jgi:hypothetical protein
MDGMTAMNQTAAPPTDHGPARADGAKARIRSSPDAVATPLGDGLALFHLRTNRYFSLNRTGTLIWSRAAEPVTIAALTDALADQFQMSSALVSRDVERIVGDMIAAQLLLVCAPEAGPDQP